MPHSSVQTTSKLPSLSGVTRIVVVSPGTASDFRRNCGTQNEWMHVLRVDPELDRAIDREHQLLGVELLRRVLEGPGELLAGHVHDHLVRLLGLDVVERDPAVDRERGDHHERDRHPDHLEPGVAVDRRPVAQVARLGPEADDGVDRDRHHQHEDRDRADQEDVVERVDLVRGRGARLREPVDPERDRDADQRGEHADPDHPGDRVLLARDPRIGLGRALGLVVLNALPLVHGARVYWVVKRLGRCGARRKMEGEVPWWRRNTLANWAACR